MFGSKIATSMLSAELAAGQPELAFVQLAVMGLGIGIKKGIQHHREKKARKEEERKNSTYQDEYEELARIEEEQKRLETAEEERRRDQQRQAEEQQRIIDQRAREAQAERQSRLDQLEQARLEENRQQVVHSQNFSAGILDREEAEREVRIGLQQFDENGDSMSEEEDEYWSYIPGGNPGGGGGNPGPNGGGPNGGNPGPNNGGFQGQGQPIGRNNRERNPYFDIIQEITRQIANQKNKEKKSVEQVYEEEEKQAPLGQDPATWSPTQQPEGMPGQNGGGIQKKDAQIQPTLDNAGSTTKYETQEEAKQAVLDNQHLTQQELQAIISAQGEQELTEEAQLKQLDLIEQQLEMMRAQNVQMTPGSIYSSVIKRF